MRNYETACDALARRDLPPRALALALFHPQPGVRSQAQGTRLRAVSVRGWSALISLLLQDDISTHKLSRPASFLPPHQTRPLALAGRHSLVALGDLK
jgi:hypothetical protein